MSNSTCSAESGVFAFGPRLGIFLSFEASLLSAASASFILCYIGNKVFQKLRARHAIRKLNTDIVLPPIDATDSLGFVGLMFADLIQALGGLLSMKWVVDGFITEDSLCQAQGHLKQIGDVGVALFSLFIAFDTFFVLVFSWRAPRAVSISALIGIGLFIILVVALGSGINQGRHPPYIGDTQYWCWIRGEYTTYRIGLEYLWMWIAAFLMIVLYGLIALVMYGFLTVEGRRIRFRNKVNGNASTDSVVSTGAGGDESKEIAKLMLFYPAIYIFCVLPVSIVRWINFTNPRMVLHPGGMIFASIVFQLSGFFNVLLYKFTRPDLVSGQTFDPNTSLTNLPVHHHHDHHHQPPLKSNLRNLPTLMVSEDGTVITRKGSNLGMLPEEMEMCSTGDDGTKSAGTETSAARYARNALTGRPHTASTIGSLARPRTQESSVGGVSPGSQGGMLPD